ncbi:MAG: hypothetical protein JKX84_04270 [Flavobacteriales bacterium]|nr:hypothetical protein [Flavobacteriales bacterium]
MDQQKSLSLLNRQLTDIQASAENILSGNDSAEAIESFARYSLELKKFVSERIEKESLKKAASEIPDINYRRNKTQVWQYLILPSWWISIYRDYQARQETKEEVITVRGKFASLQLLTQQFL